MKTCIKCHTDKTRTEFSPDKKRKDGLFPYCRECRKHGKKKPLISRCSILGRKNTDSRGYISRLIPTHPLADCSGRVKEHRMVMYAEYGAGLRECADCGVEWSWSGGRNCHIDHIDTNTSNNQLSNLRFLYAPCNVYRGHTATSMGKHFFTINGVTLTAGAWARRPDVVVAGNTIRKRRSMGYSDYDAVYLPRRTHQSVVTSVPLAKYDGVRGTRAEFKSQEGRL